MVRTVGIVDLQGDVVEHIDHFARLGVTPLRVKRPEQLSDLAGLVIPGGESTCLWRLLQHFGLDSAIPEAVAGADLKVWGTCAGAILMAAEVVGEGTRMGLLDIRVARNAFGCQLGSFQSVARIPEVSEQELPLTFIRAPKIISVGAGVLARLKIEDYIAMVESEQCLATVFHPEMTSCLAFHRYFLRKCGLWSMDKAGTGARVPGTKEADNDPSWTETSWTRLARVK